MTIEQHVQQSNLGNKVRLFIIDATAIGGELYRFTPGPLGNELVTFDGEAYIPLPIEAEGFEWSGTGALPTPTLRVANIQGLLNQALATTGDLVGATVTRIQTFDKFLDGGEDPDPTAHLPIDIFRIERKVAQNSLFVEWELSASLDQEGTMLPGRQVLRDSCSHRYRIWNPVTEDFDYTRATCPYTGSSYFNAQGLPSAPQDDKCGKRLSDCKLRFGQNGVLPTRAFPGVAKVR